MKISTSLRVTSTLAILSLGALLIGMGLSYAWLRRASAFEITLIDIQKNQFDRAALRDNYLFFGQLQAPELWGQKGHELGYQLQRLSQVALPPEELRLVNRMNRALRATESLFPRVVELKQKSREKLNTASAATDLERRLTNQLLVNGYLVQDSVNLLLLKARSTTIHARNRLLVMLGSITLLLTLVITGLTIYLTRLLAQRLRVLTAGTGIFAEGRLDARIPVTGDDELADLAHRFNAMAEKLEASYQSLTLANRELEAFTYSVSHDLRAPLRHLTGFVELLNRLGNPNLDAKTQHYLDVISNSAKEMGCLIDDLLSFSRMSRAEMMTCSVDLNHLAQEVVGEVTRQLPPDRAIQWRIGDLPVVTGDRAMLRLVLVNLIANAVKFSSRVEAPVIEMAASESEPRHHVLYVKDNGAGFNMKYVDKLFGLFQRLHSKNEFEGTGVGLANVRRIISRHGGRTWAEGELDKGATFYFTLPLDKEI